jgi:hypothetical protein
MGQQPSQKYMFGTVPVGAVTIRGGSLWPGADCVTGFSFTVVTVGTLAGAFRFYMSDDPRARQDASATDQALARWNEFTAAVAAQIVNPAGAPTNFQVMASDFRSGFVRMDFVGTGGAGAIESWYSGVGGG